MGFNSAFKGLKQVVNVVPIVVFERVRLLAVWSHGL